MKKLLITGGTGKLGSRLVHALVARGYALRVLSPDHPCVSPLVEWRRQNFLDSLEFDSALEGCDGVFHLAAELWRTELMLKVNVDATRELVMAAERAGIRTFLYTSTICVYGSPKCWRVSEDCPLISVKPRANNHIFTSDMLKEYARTKLLGEYEINKYAKNVSYIIVRPCNIASDQDIINIKDWNIFTRIWRGYRITHQVYVDDVVSAMIYLVEKNYQKNQSLEANPAVYQISNDDDPENCYHVIFSKMYNKTRMMKYRLPFYVPAIFDRVKDVVKYGNFEARYCVGAIKYLPDHLYATGFRYPTGISRAHDMVIDNMANGISK